MGSPLSKWALHCDGLLFRGHIESQEISQQIILPYLMMHLTFSLLYSFHLSCFQVTSFLALLSSTHSYWHLSLNTCFHFFLFPKGIAKLSKTWNVEKKQKCSQLVHMLVVSQRTSPRLPFSWSSWMTVEVSYFFCTVWVIILFYNSIR